MPNRLYGWAEPGQFRRKIVRRKSTQKNSALHDASRLSKVSPFICPVFCHRPLFGGLFEPVVFPFFAPFCIRIAIRSAIRDANSRMAKLSYFFDRIFVSSGLSASVRDLPSPEWSAQSFFIHNEIIINIGAQTVIQKN